MKRRDTDYNKVYSPISNKYKRSYVVKAELAMGKSIPKGAEVHHFSETQLVICQDRAYHRLLQDRTDALLDCGNTKWRKCCFCKKYDVPENLIFSQIKTYHKKCNAEYVRNYRRIN